MEPFKNVFSPDLVACIGMHLAKHIPGYDPKAFEVAIVRKLPGLEFKERAQLIADESHLVLPTDAAERALVLLAMLHPDEENRANKISNDEGICGWGAYAMTIVVGQHGIEDFDRSMQVLKEMTKRSSSELGIRYFILVDQARALKIISGWVKDENYHVRRLVSEGTRPRLPWTMQLPQLVADPSPMLPVLKALRDDLSEYVRRSVANHLNDIAKDHPDLIGDIANEWMKGADENRKKLIRHACRTLIKQGHKNTLKAFGIEAPKIELESLVIDTPQVEFGNRLEFTTRLRSTSNKPQLLVIDYVVHFKKANGSLAAKVFKWTKFTLEPGENRTILRKHPIRPITTRRYYAGEQGLSLRINGEDFGREEFELVLDGSSDKG